MKIVKGSFEEDVVSYQLMERVEQNESLVTRTFEQELLMMPNRSSNKKYRNGNLKPNDQMAKKTPNLKLSTDPREVDPVQRVAARIIACCDSVLS